MIGQRVIDIVLPEAKNILANIVMGGKGLQQEASFIAFGQYPAIGFIGAVDPKQQGGLGRLSANGLGDLRSNPNPKILTTDL